MTLIDVLAEWALRSSILIVSGSSLLWMLRVKDSSIRWAAWTALLVGSLMIPAMTAVFPRVPLTVRSVSANPALSAIVVDAAPLEMREAPAEIALEQLPVVYSKPFDWRRAAIVTYLVIALGLFLRLCVGLVMSRRMLRSARITRQLADGTEVRESGRVNAPVTVGILRPVILLPVDWAEWDEVMLDAILAHETSHIRRYDPVVQLLSAIHRSLLWFSPTSWFLHARIVRLAEDASDDAALAATRDRAAYAEMLLNFVQRGVQRGAVTQYLQGVPMARHRGMVKRIHRILDGTTFSHGITRWSVAVIVAMVSPLAWVVASAYPRTVTIPAPSPVVSRPTVQEQRIVQPERPQAAQLIAQVTVPPQVQPIPAVRPKFEIASIRPCDPNAAQAGGRGGKSGGPTTRYRRNCVTVKSMIEGAYIRFADGKDHSPMLTVLTKLEGGPAWINWDQYTIEAEAEGDYPNPMMNGPMMQTLLEDRFHLKIHREVREGPVYELTSAKGGIKMQSAKSGPCVASDFIGSPFPTWNPPPEMENVQCSFSLGWRNGPNFIRAARSATMAEFSAILTTTMDRLVVDKTGITDKVDFRLVFAPDDRTPGPAATQSTDGVPVAPDPAGPTIFTALQQQLGLKLESAKGPREYLVVDSISRPTEN